MSEIIDGEEYYTREEMDSRINKYIKDSAEELVFELKQKQKISSKEVVNV